MDMLHGPIATNIVKMAIPILLMSILQQLFNSADMIVVGRFAGSKALAAVGTNGAVMNLLINLLGGLAIGSNVVIAKLIGQGDDEKQSRAVHTSVIVAVLGGIFLALFGLIFAPDILRLIDTPDEVLGDAVLYFRICYAGMPFMMLTGFCSSILRAKGDTIRPLYILAMTGVLNVILNLVFVIVFRMGVAGVATATLITTILGSFLTARLLVNEKGALHLDYHKLSIDIALFKEIAVIGIPTGIQGMIFSFSNVIIQDGINSLGSDAMAASTAALTFDFLSYFAISAFAQAGLSFLSQNNGAKEYARCRRIINISLMLGVGSSFAVSWIFIAFRFPLASIFSTSSVVIQLTIARMLIGLPCYFVHAINETLSALMRAVGYSLVPALICIFGICGTRLIWVLAIFPEHHTYTFLNLCYPISWIATSFVMAPVGWYILRKRLFQKVR